jgi:hypothetical protein
LRVPVKCGELLDWLRNCLVFQDGLCPVLLEVDTEVVRKSTCKWAWLRVTLWRQAHISEESDVQQISRSFYEILSQVNSSLFYPKLVSYLRIIFLRNDMFSIHQMITKFLNFVTFALFLACLYITEQMKDDVIPCVALTIKKVLKLYHGCFSVAAWLWRKV